VRAAAELGDEIERVSIVGDGPLQGELGRLIAELGVADRVNLLGSRTPPEVRDLLEHADVLAMPCIVAADGDRDSMPVVVKEALAMEIPVVASDEVGLPELVRPEFGRLHAPGDPEDLARALGEVLALPAAERAEMGRRGREHVIAHANVATETAKLIELIEQAQRA
jgi:glycosyltransferase involved in cell wall biosynthesis